MEISKPSKSARKRDHLALQQLGEELIALTSAQIMDIGLDASLEEAVLAAKTIKSHGALRRQKQLIGKLMRNEDPAPIQAALSKFGRSDLLKKAIFRRAEYWRDRIVDEGPTALNEFVAELGHANDELTSLLQAHSMSGNDRHVRTTLRRIFREIHNELAMKMQNDSD